MVPILNRTHLIRAYRIWLYPSADRCRLCARVNGCIFSALRFLPFRSGSVWQSQSTCRRFKNTSNKTTNAKEKCTKQSETKGKRHHLSLGFCFLNLCRTSRMFVKYLDRNSVYTQSITKQRLPIFLNVKRKTTSESKTSNTDGVFQRERITKRVISVVISSIANDNHK